MAPFFLLVLQLLISISPVAVKAQPRHTNVSLGSSLAASDGASWLSPSGHFAFGFYPKSSGFAVGVWLTTTPKMTVVWTANRDDGPISGGYLRLTFDGRLLWSAPGGVEKAISHGSEPAVVAAMIDTGNFALYNSKGAVIWSTFDSPTDTLLLGQSLLPNNQLFSSLSEADRSTGKYRLNNQNDGNVVLYPAGTTNTADDAYWDTGTFQIGFLLTLSLDSTGLLYLTGDNGNYTKNITRPKSSGSSNGSILVYYRAIVDVDGILRLYSHSFSNNGNSTTQVEWAALQNPCLVRGVCALNSYCSLSADNEPNCLCPPGFDFIDPTKISLGCTRNSTAGDCSTASSGDAEDEGLTMVTMSNTTWVNKAYSILPSSTSMDDCKAACLDDCFCAAALFEDGTCNKQVLPLRYGRTGSNDTLFVKVGPARQSVIYQRKRKVRVDVLAISLALVGLSIVAFAVSGYLFLERRRFGRYRRTSELNSSGFDEESTLRSYSYEDLARATENFKEELGRGAFGTVFKGSLSGGSERLIAVKRLEKMVEEGEREFQREVRAIGKTHHRNLVRLLGFCNEGSNRLLVYEFMSNGSLADLLFKAKTPPNWAERCNIASDVARGLQYLHEELESNIIHCDIKPQNILMDASGTAKIADFGLAKLLMPDQTRTYTGIRGTRGYLAPEWHKNAPITVKADVYSYGVVLLEIICCKRNIALEEAGCDYTLAEVVYECLVADEVGRLKRAEAVDDAELKRMMKVGIWCVQNEPVFRPSMKNVMMMMEGHVEVPLPPPPSSFSS
ncbi:G-type lectin S-receptor-like serine/threonine-protein kinase LECRK2 [Canna indica]|uniref:Receptor-like serine/threonine-protein kinase n=1 Tax=Canna indica TaxID=4628 RepID=A0AAQ3QK03_9LILI|nr:G-type lectin S-receptor-like serine/threonine-protein kinase LECRK2 [Canna indica]